MSVAYEQQAGSALRSLDLKSRKSNSIRLRSKPLPLAGPIFIFSATRSIPKCAFVTRKRSR